MFEYISATIRIKKTALFISPNGLSIKYKLIIDQRDLDISENWATTLKIGPTLKFRLAYELALTIPTDVFLNIVDNKASKLLFLSLKGIICKIVY